MEEAIVDALECSVCLNQLDSTARVLPCQHTFCLGCLNDIATAHKEIRCPECRYLVTVPLNQLPCNIILIRILEKIKQTSSTSQSNTNYNTSEASVSVSNPKTTDFSYILNLYNTPTTVSPSTSGSASQLTPSADAQLSVGGLNLSDNGPSFNRQLCSTNVGAESALARSSSTSSRHSSTSPSLHSADHCNTICFSSPGNSLLSSSLNNVSENVFQNNRNSNPFLNQISTSLACNLGSSSAPFLRTQSMSGPISQLEVSGGPQNLLGQNLVNNVNLSDAQPQTWTPQTLCQQRNSTSTFTLQNSYPTPSSYCGSSSLFSTFLPATFGVHPVLRSETGASVETSEPFVSTVLNSSQQLAVSSASSLPGISSSTSNASVIYLPNLAVTNDSTSSSTFNPNVPNPQPSTCTYVRAYNSAPLATNAVNCETSLPSHSISSDTSLGASDVCLGSIISASDISLGTIGSTSNEHLGTVNIASDTSLGTICTSSDLNPVATTVLASSSQTHFADSCSAAPISHTDGNQIPPMLVRALYPYKSNHARDLCFEKHEILSIVRVVDSQWYVGESRGRRGYVPSAYVEVLSAEEMPRGVALYDFKMVPEKTHSSAAYCLNFRKGDVLSVLRRIDHNWAEGSLDGSVGIFPVSFVQLNAAAAALLQSALPLATTSSLSSTGTASPAKTVQETTTHPTLCPESSTVVSNFDTEPPPLTIPANTGLPRGSRASSNNMAMLYVAKFSYEPQKADEVPLTAGSLYAVTQRCNDGWFKGRCLTTHRTGVFPGNYLQPARGQTIIDYLSRRSSSTVSNSGALSNSTAISGNNSVSNSASVDSSPQHCNKRSSSVGGDGGGGGAVTSPEDAAVHQAVRRDNFATEASSPASLSSDKSKSRSCGSVLKLTGALPMLKERYRCVEPYPASSPRELSLLLGDIVSVLPCAEQPLPDGWLYGLLHKTGQQGIFPVTFVQPL